ncbi:MAG: aminotransferase class V-fold PLP-dependent enzyme [Ignavibacteriaceae bacterium]
MNDDEINNARKLFPHLQKDFVYFNHASTGPMSSRVKESLNELLYLKSEGKIDDYKELLRRADESKQLLGKILNSTADRFAFTSNTSSGLNILAQGIRWEKGDRIILGDVEFPANVYPFMNLKDIGVEIDFVKSKNSIITAEELISAITPKTKLISVSFVQFLGGYRIDLEKLGTSCKKQGIILSLDATQGLGALTLDVQKCDIDFISCGTQKWMLGLQGMAFIYISEELQSKLKTASVGWLSVENAWDLIDYNFRLKKTANRYQPGTLNTFGIYAINASLKMFDDFGFNNIEDQVLSNSKYFIEQLTDIGFTPLLKNFSKKNIAGIISFKREDAEDIFNYLQTKNIETAVREGILRISPHFYNTKDEIDKVVVELKNY